MTCMELAYNSRVESSSDVIVLYDFSFVHYSGQRWCPWHIRLSGCWLGLCWQPFLLHPSSSLVIPQQIMGNSVCECVCVCVCVCFVFCVAYVFVCVCMHACKCVYCGSEEGTCTSVCMYLYDYKLIFFWQEVEHERQKPTDQVELPFAGMPAHHTHTPESPWFQTPAPAHFLATFCWIHCSSSSSWRPPTATSSSSPTETGQWGERHGEGWELIT